MYLMTSPSKITSRQNSHVKDAVRLRSGHERRARGQIIVDGPREIARAVESDVKPITLFVCEDLCKSADCQSAISAVQATRAELLSVSPEVFEKLAFGERNDGLVLVAEPSRTNLCDLKLPKEPLVAVLEGLEKPGNVGAILRSADAAGVDAVIIADGRTDLYNPNTIRASIGTVFRKNVCEASTSETISWLQEKGVSMVAARPDAELLYTSANLQRGVAIVLGSEAAGLSQAWTDAGAVAVRLPMHGIADSLNVSTTAAVLFYEALRQRESHSR
jgi:TrmH family RNA methyltransferase